MKNYGVIARALTSLPKKDQSIWSAEALKSFLELKKAMKSAHI